MSVPSEKSNRIRRRACDRGLLPGKVDQAVAFTISLHHRLHRGDAGSGTTTSAPEVRPTVVRE